VQHDFERWAIIYWRLPTNSDNLLKSVPMRHENQFNISFESPDPPNFGRVIAGFECGLVHGGRHDLLATTKHTPEQRMREHFDIVRAHGVTTIRDGLVPGHHAVDRLRTAREAGVGGIWDLSHYHRSADPVRCARVVASAAKAVNGTDQFLELEMFTRFGDPSA
jgi:hypothetical protein